MRKILLTSIMLLTLFAFIGCSIENSSNNYETLSETAAANVISNYLDALSEKDLDSIRKYTSDEWGSIYTDETISNLTVILESAKLIKSEIRTTDEESILVDCEVEVICYEDSSPSGDWVPGKSISPKSFELVKVNNAWKVNGWGAY